MSDCQGFGRSHVADSRVTPDPEMIMQLNDLDTEF